MLTSTLTRHSTQRFCFEPKREDNLLTRRRSADHPGRPEHFIYSDLQPAGIRSGERHTHLHQQRSADDHDGNTDRDWHPGADPHRELVVECEYFVEHLRLQHLPRGVCELVWILLEDQPRAEYRPPVFRPRGRGRNFLLLRHYRRKHKRRGEWLLEPSFEHSHSRSVGPERGHRGGTDGNSGVSSRRGSSAGNVGCRQRPLRGSHRQR